MYNWELHVLPRTKIIEGGIKFKHEKFSNFIKIDQYKKQERNV